MHNVVRLVKVSLGFLLACISVVLLVMFRYILRTPQPFDSILPGEACLYKWRYGHIYYKITGAADAPPLVLFHAPGIGASSYEMRYLVEELAQYYRIYTLDLLGFGLSDRPHMDYTANLYVTLYQDFLRDVVQRPAVLLGSGLSCNYCVAVADSMPALCRRLIFITPAAIFETPRKPLWFAMLASNQLVGFVLYAFITSRPILRMIVSQRYGLARAYPESDELNYRFAAAHQFSAQHAALAFLAGKLELEVVHRLHTLGQPVQIICGSQAMLRGPHLPPPLSPQIHIDTINGSGMFPHEEQAKKIVAYIWAHENETVRPGRGLDLAAQSINEGVVIVSEGVEAYCFKCKQKREIQHAQRITTRNGRSAMEGICPICSARLFRFVAN